MCCSWTRDLAETRPRTGREQATLSGLPETTYERNFRAFEISPDGQRFLFLFPEETPETQEVVVITDWRDTLRQATQ